MSTWLKYKCKRCGNVVAIKVPNCPVCSSSDGYEPINVTMELLKKLLKRECDKQKREAIEETERIISEPRR